MIRNARAYSVSIVAIVCIDALWQMFKHRPVSPARMLWQRYCSPEARRLVLSGLPLLTISIVLMPFFSKVKSAIPLFNDFVWDETFIAWDRAIFFGNDAWGRPAELARYRALLTP